jgi:hypothetical protein
MFEFLWGGLIIGRRIKVLLLIPVASAQPLRKGILFREVLLSKAASTGIIAIQLDWNCH